MYSLTEDPPEHGCLDTITEDWISGQDSLIYNFTGLPDADFYLEFSTDIDGSGTYDFSAGNYFGMAGMTPSEAGNALDEWNAGDLETILSTRPSFKVSQASIVTADPIQLYQIPAP